VTTSTGDGAPDPLRTRLHEEEDGAAGSSSPICPDGSAIGRVLGNRYRLEQVLGAGGMGVVYKASDLQVPGELFAIKVLNAALQGHPDLVRALREEVRKTRVLSHPNVVGAYSVNSDADGDYMLMEYLEGKTLQRLLDEEFGRGIPFVRAWPLINDMCAALAYAHDHNVIHSDLKPSNVFVTTGGRVKLLDFGIARVARGPIRGFDPGAFGAMTESYASCEMLEGEAPDVRDDVYALGCVVYEMLSGKPPFSRRSAIEARALGFSAPPLATLTRRQNAALARALSFDREERTPSVEEFLEQMQPRSVFAQHWPVFAGIGAFAVVAIAGLVYFVGHSRSEATRGPVTVSAPESQASLDVARSLAQQAAALAVNPKEGLMRQGLKALGDAEDSLRQGQAAKAAPLIDRAAESLREAIRIGPRMSLVGRTPDEIESALQLCRRETGNSPDCSPASFADERARKVSLPPFALDQTPATNADFDAFTRETGYVTAAEKSHGLYAAAEKATLLPNASWRTLRGKDLPADADPAEYPVRGIDYEAAKAYCAWRGKRLPAENEWEFVARGPARNVYPWGNRAEDAPDPKARKLLPVTATEPTGAFGNRGMGGQVWEWTDGADGKPILRGPSYLVNLTFIQSLATRGRENPNEARVDTGMRCATSLDAWPDAGSGASTGQ
jgi:hypothetical protein